MHGVLAPWPHRVRPRGLSLLVFTTSLLIPDRARAQSAGAMALPPDSAHWVFEGKAEPTEYLGRRCIMLDGGAATMKDLDLRDGVIDMDVATPARRGFFGIQFRADSANAEFVYLRQHKSGLPDAMQYTPVLNTGLNWQLYSGPGFTGAAEIPRPHHASRARDRAGRQYGVGCGRAVLRDIYCDAARPAARPAIRPSRFGARRGRTRFAQVVRRAAM